MSGGFVIPGLGHARPNEKLPASSFAPDILAAAASLGGDAHINEALAATTSVSTTEDTDLSAPHESVPTEQTSGNGDEMDTSGADDAQRADASNSEPTAVGSVASGMEDVMDVDQKAQIPSADTVSSAALNTDASSTADVFRTTASASSSRAERAVQQQRVDANGDSTESPHVTDALDAALLAMTQPSGQDQARSTEAAAPSLQEPPQRQPPPEQEGEGAEWEADSSPYESSSDSSSSDDSSDEDSDGEAMGLEETVRMLMAGADGSDDEGDGGDGKGAKAAQVRSKNELPDWVPPKPEVAVSEDAEILPLGTVSTIVGTQVLVQSGEDGEEKVLDVETPVCRADRTIVAAIADVIGSVLKPMYILRFQTPEDLEKEALTVGTVLYYPPRHAQVVLTRALRKQKGYDASNLHDEELPPEEMEFSDDEQEQAYKRELKQKKRGNRGRGGGAAGGNARDGGPGGRPGSSATAPSGVPDAGLNYDEEDDGPYKPLTRPANFGMGAPPSSEETVASGARPPHAAFNDDRRGRRDHARGGGRGGNRGGRGGFRGGRGGGGGSGHSDGFSKHQQPRFQNQHSQPQHPPPPPQQQQQQQQQQPLPPPSAQQWNYPPPPPLPFAPPQTSQPGAVPFAFPPFPPPAAGQYPPPPPPPPPVAGQAAPNWQAMSALYSNPAFVEALRQAQQVQQQQQRYGQGQGQPGWGQNPR